jgi:hypothetical protein
VLFGFPSPPKEIIVSNADSPPSLAPEAVVPPAPTVTAIGVPVDTINPVAVLYPPAPPPPPRQPTIILPPVPPPPPATTRYSTDNVVGTIGGLKLIPLPNVMPDPITNAMFILLRYIYILSY